MPHLAVPGIAGDFLKEAGWGRVLGTVLVPALRLARACRAGGAPLGGSTRLAAREMPITGRGPAAAVNAQSQAGPGGVDKTPTTTLF